MRVIFIINNFWRFWYDIETWWSMASYVFFMLGLLSTNPLYFHNLKCFRKRIIFLQKNARAKWTRIHFFGSYESSHDTNSIFLQAKNAQTRTNSNCGKPNVSKNGSPIFYKRTWYTTVLFNRIFFSITVHHIPWTFFLPIETNFALGLKTQAIADFITQT